MKPMMWMGRFSALMAFGLGGLLAAFAALQLIWGVVSWQLMLAAALLMTGAFRTLSGMSGGLRLLCGAWGFAAGIGLMAALFTPGAAGYRTVSLIADIMVIAVPLTAFFGLALTVLHKEWK